MNKDTIEIPLKKASYEDIQALNIELQTRLFAKERELQDTKEYFGECLHEKDKELEHLQCDLESEQNKTSILANRTHHALGYIEGAVEVDIGYVCSILLGKEDDKE